MRWILTVAAAIGMVLGGAGLAFAFSTTNPPPAPPQKFYCTAVGSVSLNASLGGTQVNGTGYQEVRNIPHPCPAGFVLTIQP
jgi:hypothetical protein